MYAANMEQHFLFKPETTPHDTYINAKRRKSPTDNQYHIHALSNELKLSFKNAAIISCISNSHQISSVPQIKTHIHTCPLLPGQGTVLHSVEVRMMAAKSEGGGGA